MPFSVVCPSCLAKLKVREDLVGRQVKCPQCRNKIGITPHNGDGLREIAPDSPQTHPKKHLTPPPLRPDTRSVALQPAAPAPAAEADELPLTAATGPKPLVPIVAAGVGGLVLGGGLVFALFVAGKSEEENLPRAAGNVAGQSLSQVSPTAGPPSPAPPPLSERQTSVASADAAQSVGADLAWFEHEEPSQGFKAAFPGEKPGPIDPAASLNDPSERKLAAALTKNMAMFGATFGGRKYTVTAAPLVLGSTPAGVYLDRLSGNLGRIHPGFDIQRQTNRSGDRSARDFLLKKKDAAKLLRVIVGKGHSYQLLVEGEAGLTFDDPTARTFLERFETTGVKPVADRRNEDPHPEQRGERPPSQAAMPQSGPKPLVWQMFTGKAVPFTLSFPQEPQKQRALDQIGDRKTLSKTQLAWVGQKLIWETYAAQMGDKRFVITAWQDREYKMRDGRHVLSRNQWQRMAEFVEAVYGPQSPKSGISQNNGGTMKRTISWLTPENGGKVIVCEGQSAYCSFVAAVEGPETMENNDPQVRKFFDSLKCTSGNPAGEK